MATIMRKMNIISRCEAIYRGQKSSVNLGGIYHSYFFAVCNNPGITQDGLARQLCKNKSSVARQLATLENDGYVRREESQRDKRETLVYPTDKMLRLLPEVRSITSEWNALLAEGITEKDLEIFHSVLDRMLAKSKQLIYGEDLEK